LENISAHFPASQIVCKSFISVCSRLANTAFIGVGQNIHNQHRRTGRHFTGGGRKKFALKITICPEINLLLLSEWGLKPYVNLFYTVEFVYNGFPCNVNSPLTLHFVWSRWHLLYAFKFAYNVNSATTFFMQSSRGAAIGKFCSYLAC